MSAWAWIIGAIVAATLFAAGLIYVLSWFDDMFTGL